MAFRMFQFPNLININIFNNPVEREASSFEVLMATFLIKNPRLKTFCKAPVTE